MSSFSSLKGLPAELLLHHRGNMLLLDTLLEMDSQHAVCQWQASENCALMVAGKGIPAYAAIECMAQCIAVYAGGMARLRSMAPPLGLLLGTRHFQSMVDWLQPGQVFRIECQELIRDEQGMASFDCTMTHRNETIAACRLAVYEKESGERLHD